MSAAVLRPHSCCPTTPIFPHVALSVTLKSCLVSDMAVVGSTSSQEEVQCSVCMGEGDIVIRPPKKGDIVVRCPVSSPSASGPLRA